MKKKGFTLIELLAVIVILAIIALVATPLVLKYIEKSRKESKVDSAYSFVRNLETEIANFSIKHNGKKYNGQPTDKGYYELTSFENSEIDTTVKGDKPNSIKVCLSSLGQVEKAMFEYGKYYVSYNGKKGSISDKETYDNFSCSGNGNAVANYIIDEDLEFAYEEFDEMFMSMATLSITPEIAAEFKEGFDYDFIIDNGSTSLMYLTDDYNDNLSFNAHVSDRTKEIKYIYILQGTQMNIIVSGKLSGTHNVKIGNIRPVEERLYFGVNQEGNVTIVGYDLLAGNANLVIKNNEGKEYYNDMLEFKDNSNDGIMGADYNCRENLPLLSEVYTDLTNGKTITIEVTQGDKTFKISKNIDMMVNIGERYMSRMYILLTSSSAC